MEWSGYCHASGLEQKSSDAMTASVVRPLFFSKSELKVSCKLRQMFGHMTREQSWNWLVHRQVYAFSNCATIASYSLLVDTSKKFLPRLLLIFCASIMFYFPSSQNKQLGINVEPNEKPSLWWIGAAREVILQVQTRQAYLMKKKSTVLQLLSKVKWQPWKSSLLLIDSMKLLQLYLVFIAVKERKEASL